MPWNTIIIVPKLQNDVEGVVLRNYLLLVLVCCFASSSSLFVGSLLLLLLLVDGDRVSIINGCIPSFGFRVGRLDRATNRYHAPEALKAIEGS